MTISSSLQSKITLALRVFLIGMVRQFLAHTILTYGLKIPSSLSFIWVWKELIIAGVGIIAARFFISNNEYRKRLMSNQRAIAIVISIILSIIISVGNSLGIHGQSIIDFAVSAKFNYIPLIIFIVGLSASYLITQEQNKSVINTALTTIKWVLIFSLFRYGVLHTIPNILDWIGFSQPGLSIEWTAGTPPPSLWLTEFYTGYVRNQGPFGGPLSLGFYLAAMRPLFYGLVLHKKNISDTRGRRILYIGIVLSTYSRAARGIFLISSVFLALIVYRKYTKYIIALGLTAFVAVALYIAGGGTSELFLRTWSDKGHIEYFFQGLDLVKQHRLRGLGAASVGPGSNHIADVDKVFNPENQYMQIWLEYGLFGVISWILSYIALLFDPIKKWFRAWISKSQQVISGYTISYMGIGISIIALSVAGMVLHPFVDSSSMYPFMLISGILFGYYHQYTKYEKPEQKKLTKKEQKLLVKQDFVSISSSLTEKKHRNTTSLKSKITKLLNILPYLRTILISVFFILQTYITFGIHVIDSSIIMSTVRDILFALIIGISIILGWKSIRCFVKTYWFIIVPILLSIVINIGYIINTQGSVLAIIAGIKYDIFQYIILGAGIWLGFLLLKRKKGSEIYAYIKRFLKFSLIMILLGVMRQLGKNILPDIFLSYLGYSSPSDFVPYTKPPIYYITGAGGIERLSGFFVGPNTLGFFLITMTSILYYYAKKTWSKKYLIIGTILYLVIALFTLSRGAIVGITFQILALIGYGAFIVGKQTFKQSEKILFGKRLPYIIVIVIASLVALWGVNLWKNDSNSERSTSGETISKIVATGIPLLGYGPGHVGPARHYDPNYLDDKKNDHAMLENIYLQTIINQGWIGFSILLSIIISLLFIHHRIRMSLATNNYSNSNLSLLTTTQYMGLGLMGLLLIGGFLHTFIDSMVNYLFFLPYGVLIGYSYGLISSQANLSTNS